MSYGDSTGELASYRFEYDSLGRLIRSAELDADGGTVQRTEHIYDGYNRLSRQSWTLGGKTYTEYYSYDDATDGSMTSFRTTAEQTLHFTYDALRRLQKTTVTDGGGTLFTVARSYYTTGGKATTRTEYFNYRMPDGSLIAGDRYVYDALGNITELREAEPASGSSARRTKVRYTYDEQNQLRTETRYTYSSNADTTGTSVTYTYNYDTAGNLQSVQKNGATVQTYTYGDSQWRDLLTKVGGTTISYDASGNPKNWYNGTTYTGLTWKNGRQLAQITTGGRTSAYRYDADGIRTYKKVGSVAHEYRTLNGKVVYEKIGSGSTAKIMVFSYDAQGRPFAVKYSANNGGSYITYFYALNQQGDVVKIFRPLPSRDSNGNLIGLTEAVYATYTYDAWGNILSQSGSMAGVNPLRYRGYYYDSETGFYYLQSRYYDPANRRFINADRYVNANGDLIGFNMYAYCSNNPVMFTDPSGENIWDWLKDKANDVEKWLSDTFGFAAYVEGDVATVEVDVILGAVETGHSASTLVSGDDSKPITFYAIAPAKWWDVFGYSVGVKYNDDGNGADVGVSPGQVDVSVCVDNTSVTASGGIFEAGVTVGRDVDLQQGSIGSYTSVYVRPWALALAYATFGMAIPALAPVLLPA